MHELSIAQSIIGIIEDEIKKNSLGRITTVRLKIGKLTAIEPSSLSFCFELITKGTLAEGAHLEIDAVPITARCNECQKEFTLEYPFGSCPSCQNLSITIIAGRELYISEIEADN